MKHHARYLVCFCSLIALLAAISAPAFADLAKCGCYCGALTDPPCSEAKCKQACGWAEGGSGGGRPGGDGPANTMPDPVTERHNKALDINREGFAAVQNRDWRRAVERFNEALRLWPENSEIRRNLGDAEKAKQAAQDSADRIKLDKDLDMQDKKDRAIADLNRGLKDQDEKDQIANLDKEFRTRDRQESIRKHEAIIAGLVKQMRVDQQAIRTIGLYDPRDPEKRARDFEAWGKLAEETQLEREKELMEDVLAVIEGMAAASITRGAKSINPVNVGSMTTRLKSLGVTDPYFLEAMDVVGRTAGNKAAMKKLLSRLHVVVAAVELGVTPKPEDASRPQQNAGAGFEEMDGLAAVLTLVDSKYKVLAAELRFLTSALYDHAVQRVSRRTVESMTRLTEEQLSLVVRYNERMKVCGREIARERETVRQLFATR